jgi:hypothetical protein
MPYAQTRVAGAYSFRALKLHIAIDLAKTCIFTEAARLKNVTARWLTRGKISLA